jgi:hypothetical protein
MLITALDRRRVHHPSILTGAVVKSPMAFGMVLVWALAASGSPGHAQMPPTDGNPLSVSETAAAEIALWVAVGSRASSGGALPDAADGVGMPSAAGADFWPADLAQAPTVPPAQGGAADPDGDGLSGADAVSTELAIPLPPAVPGSERPSPAAKACLFAAASTLPLVPDAKITSASAAPMGSMTAEDMFRDFRVILIVDALAMSTTVEFLCRSADTPEIFGAEILSARILE